MNETNQTYLNLVVKIQVYISNKTQNSNYFYYFKNRDRIKKCLTLWQKYKFHELPSIGYLVMAEGGKTDGGTDGQRQTNIPPPSTGD